MTRHDDQQRQHGSIDRDEDDEQGDPVHVSDQRGTGEQGSSVQDRGNYGGLASGEGQGEFAGDGYSAQGQFSDQGNAQDYGRQGIGWQNRQQTGESDGQGSSGQRESPAESQRDEPRSGTNNS
jgi:hypothetical protein